MSHRGRVEYAGSSAAMSAYRSLAKAAGVDLDLVLRHAMNNTLAVVVAEARGGDKVRNGQDAELARSQQSYLRKVLAIRRRAPDW